MTLPCGNLSSCICRQQSPDQPAQSDQGLHCQLTESLDTTKYMNGQQRLGYFAHPQSDLNLQILHMFEGIFFFFFFA